MSARWRHPDWPGPVLVLGLVAGLAVPEALARKGRSTSGGKASPRVEYPKLLKFVKAPYPEAARRAGKQGVVLLEVTVGVKGRVTTAKVVKGVDPALDQAALTAVKQFQYRAARVDGKPVAAKIRVAYPFRLKKAVPAVKTPPKAPPATQKTPRVGRPSALRPKPPRPIPPKTKTAAPVVSATAAVLRGRVRQKGTRTPLEDAEVIAYRRTSAAKKARGVRVASTYSARTGRFVLKGLPPGRYRIEVRVPGAYTYRVTEKLEPGGRLTVEYFVQKRDALGYETIVTGRAERKEVSRHRVALPEIQKIPGTQGDALRSIQNMPGVARASFGAGALAVRGAAPGDTRVFLHGHEIPQLFHFFGLTSVVNSDILKDIVFVPGNFSVRYGRATGGIIDVYTRKGKRDGWHGYLDVDLWDFGALLEGPVGKGSIALSFRRSHIDAIFALLPKGTLGPTFTLAPAYYDYSAMLDYPVLGGDLKVMFFGSDDRIKLLFDGPIDIDDSARGVSSTVLFHRFMVLYNKRFGPNQVKASVSTGYQEIDTFLGEQFRFELRVWRTNWRFEYARKISDKLSVAVGLDGEYSTAWLDFSLPPVTPEGEVPLPAATQPRVTTRVGSFVYSQAWYLEATYKPVKRLTLIPGIRVDFLKLGEWKNYVFDPRFTAKLAVTKKLELSAAVGMYHQEPEPTDLEAIVGGNPDVTHERTLHTSVGLAWKIRPGLKLETTGFYKHLTRRIVASDRFIERGGEVVPENVANRGRGRIYGGELLLRKNLDRDCPRWLKLQKCFGWISYTLMRSERQDGSGERWRLFDFDQTHILTVILSGAWEGGWQLGVRFRLASGNPYTALTKGFLDADAGVYTGLPGPINAERLPLFHQLDIRLDKKFVFKRWVLSIYLDIQNVYNYRPSEIVTYNFNYTQRSVAMGLPIIPSIGIKGAF